MKNAIALIQSLLQEPVWASVICECSDQIAKRWVLFACAKTVLPYWDSRFHPDESMSNIVDCMANSAQSPTFESDSILKAAIPKREFSLWEISQPLGFIEGRFRNCPADFAGDSVFYAACVFLDQARDDHDDFAAFETAKECFTRLFVERDPNYDDADDYRAKADKHLREKMLEFLKQESM